MRALLMGGQACVLYGAAEFSRDTDLVIRAEAANLARLRRALSALQAEVIAVSPLSAAERRRVHRELEAKWSRCSLRARYAKVRFDVFDARILAE